jgi:hypothetical protein
MDSGKCVLPTGPLCKVANRTDKNDCIVCNSQLSYTYPTTHPSFECLTKDLFINENVIAPAPEFTNGSIKECQQHH